MGFPSKRRSRESDEIADDLAEQGNQLEVQFGPGVRGFDLDAAADVIESQAQEGSMRIRIIVSGCLAAVVCVAGLSAQARRTERVVLVTLDGSRWQDVFTGLDESLLRASSPKDADITKLPAYQKFWAATPEERREKLMPFLWRTLVAREGAIAGNRARGSAVSVTNRHWFSYPGYSEILTGQAHDDVIRSNDAIRNAFPTVLQFVKRKLHQRPGGVATFASWGVFSSIVENAAGDTMVNAGLQPYNSSDVSLKAMSLLQDETRLPWDNTRHDAYTFHFAMDYLKREQPVLLYIAFDETDDWAHDGKYELVLQALHREDAYLQTLWTALQADPLYRDRTTLIVTADHGRGREGDGWKAHRSSLPGSDEVWLAIASPDVSTRGEWHDHAPLFQNQIAATIAGVLGLDYREQNAAAGPPLPMVNLRKP